MINEVFQWVLIVAMLFKLVKVDEELQALLSLLREVRRRNGRKSKA